MLCARTLPGLLTLSALAPIAIAQTAAGNSFEVVSVKTGGDPSRGMSMYTRPSGFSVANVTLKYLIQFAWDVKSFQISGGPGWIGSDRFTIEAKSEHRLDGDLPGKYTAQLHSRIRSLLADRFELRLHTDRTGLSGYYDYALTWTPDSAASDQAAGPSLFTAVQEQLGLRLKAAKGPVQMLVIDQAEKPSAN